MASVRVLNDFCTSCDTKAGVFTCRGCSQSFCMRHSNEHRHNLELQMNEVESNYKRLNNCMTSQACDAHHECLMKQVDQWVKQSVDKIQNTANEIRQQLLCINRNYRDTLTENLAKLSRELTKARCNAEYFESDLRRWRGIVQRVQCTIDQQQRLKIDYDDRGSTYVSRINLHEIPKYELKPVIKYPNYEREKGLCNVEILPDTGYQCEYSWDDFVLRFQLQGYDPVTSTVLMGIVSGDTVEIDDSFKNLTFYGWSTDNFKYKHGITFGNYDDCLMNIRKNDVFQLILRFRRKQIVLINERTQQTFDMNVDTCRCPLPWEPHVRVINKY